MLDFIVPHYNEPWSVGKPFFDMLAMQKGIDFDDIRVLLIHDGSDMFPEKTFNKYPYKVEQHRIAHKGVSAARNFGIDLATAKWVSFCDFDDSYTDIYALKMILDLLETDDYDMLWNPIYMEDMRNGRLVIYPLLKFNMIFVHNKYIRLDYLIEKGLRFNEDLAYSEDSAFLAILNVMLDHKRIGAIRSPAPLYTWAYRAGSCTTSEKNKLRNVQHLFNGNRYIAKSFEDIGYEDATLMKFRAVCDAYYALTSSDAPANCEDLKKQVANFWTANKSEIGKCDKVKLQKVMKSSHRNVDWKKGVKRPSLSEWLKQICSE